MNILFTLQRTGVLLQEFHRILQEFKDYYRCCRGRRLFNLDGAPRRTLQDRHPTRRNFIEWRFSNRRSLELARTSICLLNVCQTEPMTKGLDSLSLIKESHKNLKRNKS